MYKVILMLFSDQIHLWLLDVMSCTMLSHGSKGQIQWTILGSIVAMYNSCCSGLMWNVLHIYMLLLFMAFSCRNSHLYITWEWMGVENDFLFMYYCAMGEVTSQLLWTLSMTPLWQSCWSYHNRWCFFSACMDPNSCRVNWHNSWYEYRKQGHFKI